MQNQTDAAVRLRLFFLMDGSEDKKLLKNNTVAQKGATKRVFALHMRGESPQKMW